MLSQSTESFVIYCLILIIGLLLGFIVYYIRALKEERRTNLNFVEDTDEPLKDNFSFIVNNIGDIIYTADINGFFTFVNFSSEELLGYKPEELIGKHFTFLVHEDDQEMVRQFYYNQFSTKKYKTILDFRVYTKKGKMRWVQQSVKIHILDYEKGQIDGFQAVVRDITKQKDLEKKYKFLISNAKDGIYISNYNGDFTFVNDSMKNILGFESFELQGKNYMDVIHPDDKEEVISFYKQQMKGGGSDTFNEFRVVDKFGRCKWVAQNVKAIPSLENKGHVAEFHAIVRDVTTRKVYEMELDRLSMVARKTTNIILFLNNKNEIQWVNEAFTKVFGYQREEVIGKIPGEVLNGPKTDPKVLNDIVSKIQAGKGIKAELLNYTKSGEAIWIELTMDPIVNSEGEKGYIAVEQEITERKYQEELILHQNKEIKESINYSSRIQQSIIPSEQVQKSILSESFVWYQPKDVVSGDFFMVDRLKAMGMYDYPVFVVADCTGHGVPGAMLSVMCNGILQQAFEKANLSSASEILDFTREKLIEVLNNTQEAEILDGMDLALGIWDQNNNEIHFSGANRPLWLIREGEILEYKANRQHIGYSTTLKPFSTERIQLQEGDQVYIFSDGIIDQFGGEKGKRFMSKKLKQLLLSVANMEIEQQKETIKQTLIDWQGSNYQTDDICIMGIKF